MSDPATNRDLDRIQKWMHAVVTHPAGVSDGIKSRQARAEIDVAPPDIESVILPSKRQDSLDRLGVYANAYYARLLECLRNEFPATVRALTEETFNSFAFDYLQQYPSQSYTLSMLGRRFARYLAETRPPRPGADPDWADFLIDLVELEACYSEVFDGPGIENERTVTPADLARIPEEQWPECRLVAAPCVRLRSARFPVHEYVSAVRRGDEPSVPDPRDVRLVVTRHDFVIRRFEVQPDEFELLNDLLQGQSVGSAIAAQAARPAVDTPQLAKSLREWFRRWAEWRLFLRVE